MSGASFWHGFYGERHVLPKHKRLSTSLIIGVLASAVSSVLALILGISAAVIGGKFDKFINWCVDCCMGLPHLVLLLLISFMLGRGVKAWLSP
jgi:peptide/nickel transport system permease protein